MRGKDLFETLNFAKKERIDKQDYVDSKIDLTSSACKDLFLKSENFLNEIKLILENLNLSQVEDFRNKFKEF